jgi:protein KRI1
MTSSFANKTKTEQTRSTKLLTCRSRHAVAVANLKFPHFSCYILGKMSKIFEGDSDSDADIKTDNDYAKNYDNWRKKEELNKLKTKYGEELLDEDASSSSDDDDDGIELTEEVEKQFFKTLSCLKNKDPRIYDATVRFFDGPEDNLQKVQKKVKKEKPLYINDYERELILKKNGELSESDEEKEDPRARYY